jgi:predicted amino acid dehydrogenase
MKTIQLIIDALSDLLIHFFPTSKREYGFAFIVHPRDMKDVYRKYPFLRNLPERLIEKILSYYWPITVSKITGLKSLDDKKQIDGYVISIPLTAKKIMENRGLALKKTRQAIKLASKKGAKIVGLGGLTSSISKGGIDLVDNPHKISITTGHAYTAYNVTENLRSLSGIFFREINNIQIAIVGAAGSVGSTSAKLLARDGFKKILLVDLERKKGHFTSLINDLKQINPHIEITTSHQIRDISGSDFIITATNAPEAIIRADDVKSGAIIIDDAQPSDVSPETLLRPDVLVVEAGVVSTPGIHSNFNFNLKNRDDNFCCLAEVLILAANKWGEHYVINRASLDLVDKIVGMSSGMGFKLGQFQNFNEVITSSKMKNIKNIISSK